MKNKKIKLTEKVALKNLKAEKSQFDIPKRMLVDFYHTKLRNKYDDERKRPTNEFEAYVTAGYEENVGKLVKEGILDSAQAVPIICWFTGKRDLVENLIQKSEQVYIELIDFDVRLHFVGQDGKGRYEKYKLIVRDFKISDK